MSVVTRSLGVVLLVFLAARWLAAASTAVARPLAVTLVMALAVDLFIHRRR